MKQLLLCFWAYASCHVTCVQQTMNCEPLQASAALSFLLESGEFAVILIYSRAFSPVLGSGVTTTAGLLDQRKFPAGSPWLFLLLQKLTSLLLTKRPRDCSDSELSPPTKNVKSLLHFKNDPLDIISSNVSLSTASLKKNKVFFDMSTTMPPRPLYLSRSTRESC